MITFPDWFWPAIAAWLIVAGLGGTVWAVLGARAKSPQQHAQEDQ